jgi:hypothetical protein
MLLLSLLAQKKGAKKRAADFDAGDFLPLPFIRPIPITIGTASRTITASIALHRITSKDGMIFLGCAPMPSGCSRQIMKASFLEDSNGFTYSISMLLYRIRMNLSG